MCLAEGLIRWPNPAPPWVRRTAAPPAAWQWPAQWPPAAALPYLTEVILEGIDEVKTYRVDKIEFELDKINGKWEIKAEN